MPVVDSHSLEAVQLPSILAIVLRPSVHSIQPDAGQGHAYALIGAKTESESKCKVQLHRKQVQLLELSH